MQHGRANIDGTITFFLLEYFILIGSRELSEQMWKEYLRQMHAFECLYVSVRRCSYNSCVQKNMLATYTELQFQLMHLRIDDTVPILCFF